MPTSRQLGELIGYAGSGMKAIPALLFMVSQSTVTIQAHRSRTSKLRLSSMLCCTYIISRRQEGRLYCHMRCCLHHGIPLTNQTERQLMLSPDQLHLIARMSAQQASLCIAASSETCCHAQSSVAQTVPSAAYTSDLRLANLLSCQLHMGAVIRAALPTQYAVFPFTQV